MLPKILAKIILAKIILAKPECPRAGLEQITNAVLPSIQPSPSPHHAPSLTL
jgi:hypothetical protein